MEINLIVNDGEHTVAWHINPTECDFLVDMRDCSLTIKPKDSAWAQVQWGLEVATDQQIDPTKEPWPEILARVAEREAAANAARRAATEANALTK
jgi:hypothetical protein